MYGRTTHQGRSENIHPERVPPGEDPAALADTTPLMTTGILDSIAVLKVVTFLESQFGVTIGAHETGVENLNTLSDIAHLVMSKA